MNQLVARAEMVFASFPPAIGEVTWNPESDLYTVEITTYEGKEKRIYWEIPYMTAALHQLVDAMRDAYTPD